MNFRSKFCCFCSAKQNILNLSDQDSDGITHIHKLRASVVGMDFEALDIMRFICGECCTTLNTVYRFQQQCLRSKRNLEFYVSQLQTFSKVSGSVSVCLRDIRQETEAEDQSVKSQTTFTNIKLEDLHNTVPDNVLNAYMKQEYDSDEDDDIVTEKNQCINDVGVKIKEEHVNMVCCNEYNLGNLIPIVLNTHSDIEHETVNHNVIGHRLSNIEEDFTGNQHVNCKNEIDIEEHSVSEVKEEAVSDSETPTKGPSQGDRSAAALDTATGSPLVGRRKHHTGNGPYECLKCKEVFDTKKQHTRHMIIHSDVKPLQSEIGKKTFRRKIQLQDNVRTYTEGRPYECNVCNKGLCNSYNLKLHMRTHTGERPYECGVCKKRFSRSTNLKEHMRTHTGERPYECDVCKKRFIYASNLKQHATTHW